MQGTADENMENRTETGQRFKPKAVRTLSKSHADYWQSRLRKRSYTELSGLCIEIPDWQVRLQRGNRESWFNLGTSNQVLAAKKAREIYVFLQANGWELTLAKYKPETVQAPGPSLTVGEYLERVHRSGKLKEGTFLNYQNGLRTILAGAFGIRAGKEKYDHRGGGQKQWAAKINRIRLDRITLERVSKWQQRFVRDVGDSPAAIASAQRTANSYVRCARSLFSAKLRETGAFRDSELPEKLPFEGVRLFPAGSTKYISKIDATELIVAAKTELKTAQPEVYKAFLLGLFGGLRKKEIDLAEWAMVDWKRKLIRVQQTEWLGLKTSDSAGDVPLDEEVLTELRTMTGENPSQFIVRSNRQPKVGGRGWYRCERVFQALTKWLRAKGIESDKPLHELRKEIGSLINEKHGIYAASRFLRHSDISTTARHYLDQKQRVSAGLGKILDSK